MTIPFIFVRKRRQYCLSVYGLKNLIGAMMFFHEEK